MDDELAEIRKRKMQDLMHRLQEPPAPTVAEPLGNGNVHLLTDATFWNTVQQTNNSLIDFYGEWCSPCKMLAPIFGDLALDYKGQAFFGKIDIDRNPRTTAQFGVQSVPMVIAFKRGQPVGKLPGLRNYVDYDQILQRMIGS